jgi:hypothetical protein
MALLLRLEPAVCLVREWIDGGGVMGEPVDGGDWAVEAMEELRVVVAVERAAGGSERESIAARLCGWISDEGAGVGNCLDMTMEVSGRGFVRRGCGIIKRHEMVGGGDDGAGEDGGLRCRWKGGHEGRGDSTTESKSMVMEI